MRNNFNQGLGDNPHFRTYKFITAHRRPQNLKDLLVHAKIPTPRTTPKTSILHLFKQTKFVQNQKNKQVFPTEPIGHIRSRNCIYLISCKQCSAQFLGETETTLITRLCQHRFKVNFKGATHRKSGLVTHFSIHGPDSILATILQSSRFWTTQQRYSASRVWLCNLSLDYVYSGDGALTTRG